MEAALFVRSLQGMAVGLKRNETHTLSPRCVVKHAEKPAGCLASTYWLQIQCRNSADTSSGVMFCLGSLGTKVLKEAANCGLSLTV